MAGKHLWYKKYHSPETSVSMLVLGGRYCGRTLQFMGELAEDSLEVPSYMPAFISDAIKYWLSATPSLYPVVIAKHNGDIISRWYQK